MKLFNLVKLIKTLCLNQPNVNTFFEGDIYDLNHKQDIDYSVMVLTHQTHDISVDAEYESFGCNLFYVDRLTSDGDNRLDVQSHAITVLEGVINELENQGFYIERVTINEFTERFDAECAGAYAQVKIRANSNCCCNDYKIVTSVNGMRGDVVIDIETGTTVDQYARDLAEEALEKANQVENATFHTVLPNLISANEKIEELERKTSDIIKIDDWGTNIDINGETSAAYNDTTLGGVSMMFADILEGGAHAPKGVIGVNTDGVEIKGANGKDVKVNTQSIGDPSKFLYNGNEVLTDKALKEYMEEQHLSFEDAEVVEWATWDVSVWKSGMYRVVKNNTRMPSENLEGFGIVFHTKEGEGTDDNGHYFVHYFKKVFFEDAGPLGFEEPKVRIKSGSAYIYDNGLSHFGGISVWHTIAVTDDIIKYKEGTGIKIDAVTNVISSTAPTQFKTINGDSIIGEGNIVIGTGGTTYDDSELRGRIETLESNEGTFQTDIDTLNSEVDTLSTQMENKAEKGDSYTKEESNRIVHNVEVIAYEAKAIAESIGERKADWQMVDEVRVIADEAKDIAESKQDELLSGVNIKTINGEDILGEGDIEIKGGSSYDDTELRNRISAIETQLNGLDTALETMINQFKE